ncbi:MAG: DUF1573 domain-containing protein [Cytophagales bacterium]|nr:MAG: DUF1573 domain-containing protein [Cytophagales bacterium]
MMKKFLFSLLMLLLSITIASAQTLTSSLQTTNPATQLNLNPEATQPEISFVERDMQFGQIKHGEQIKTTFYFKNTGKLPLIIFDVQTSCGCTATQWDRKPIAPNETGMIEVIYSSGENANQMGAQKKVIIVFSNATNKEEKLTLTGEVLPK